MGEARADPGSADERAPDERQRLTPGERKRRSIAPNRFEELLFSVSNELIAARFDDLPAAVAQAMQKICDCYGMERGSLWWLQQQTGLGFGNLAVGYGEQPKHFAIREFSSTPWASKYLFAGNLDVLVLPDEYPEDDHDASRDRECLDRQGIRSLLFVPLSSHGAEAGLGSVSSLTRPRTWTEAERFELSHLVRVAGAAWTRYVRQHLSQHNQRDLMRSQRIAEVGSYQLLASDEAPLHWGNARIAQSEQASRIRGIQAGELAWEHILACVHRDDRARVSEALDDIAQLETNSPLAYRIRLDDGRILHVEERFELDLDANGRVERVFGTIINVTAQVEITERLALALQENEQLRARLSAENVALRREVRAARGFERILGGSDALRRTLAKAEQVAPTDVPVLILGETGTGKELLARSIHEISGRHEATLISVNCAVMSSELIESEIFGHEKGAFTDAVTSRKGRFELADQGTLFLDEIGELPIDMQAKLLRVLQSGEFERLGGSETLHADVRLLAATNRDLEKMVERGEFRSDLYYRINQFPITMPPLRERPDDIPVLASHFLAKHARTLAKNFTAISARMLEDLLSSDWPGNVRQLEGHIQRSMIGAEGPILDVVGAAASNRPAPAVQSRAVAVGTHGEPADTSDDSLSLAALQRRHITAALEACNWTVDGDGGAAAVLGLPASSLRSRMKRLGIERRN